MKQRTCAKKLLKLQALVENILKLPKEMLKKGSGMSLKSLGEQVSQMFEEINIEEVEKELEGEERLGSFQGGEVLQLLQSVQGKAEVQQSFFIMAKAMVMEQSQTFQCFAKRTKDETFKQIFQTDIKFNEKQHLKDIKHDIDQYFCGYRVISFDPVCPRPLNPMVEEPGETFDSQKILEDISSYNLQDIIKVETEMSNQGELWLQRIQEKILAQQA